MPRFPHDSLSSELYLKVDNAFVDDNLTCMFKVYGDLASDVGLHLAQAPIGPVRVSDDHPRFQN